MKRLKEHLKYLSFSRLWNYARIRCDIALRKSHIKGYPIFLIVEPCNYCNLKCPMCPTGQRLPTNRGTMKLETFKRIIDQLHPYAWHLNLYYLGEPLLCEHLPLMISYAQQHKIRVTTSSNLNIFNEKMAEKLIDSKLDNLIISLDGASPESYEKYRIGGDFEKVINNIRLIIAKKNEKKSLLPRLQIQFVIFKHNEAEIPKVKSLAEKLGVDLFFRQGALGGKGQSPPLTKDIILARKWLSANEKYNAEYDYFSQKPYIKNGICLYLWGVATINWDGSVLPCCWIYEGKHSFGNILEQPFKSIWNNELIQSSRSLFSRRKKSFLKLIANEQETICHKCKMFKHFLNENDQI